MPTITKLSYLPFRAARFLPREEYDRIMADMAAMVAEELTAILADRDKLERMKQECPVGNKVKLNYEMEPQHREVRCASPLVRALLQLVQEMIALDEAWAEFAWNADHDRVIACDWQEVSQFAAYEHQHAAWLDRLHQLRHNLKGHLKKLRQACHPTKTPDKSYAPEIS
ncbi:MAG TPA: hypothetical protein DCY27_00435 [Desulfobacterales bacterium]|nr:hypothetical protein [Desulfobacterales bacterium]